ncbi:MAG TPA: ABC transporter permease, partial [Clostridiales bacterium]|nr:ABC transporter permease [Clostridiales bacterium]
MFNRSMLQKTAAVLIALGVWQAAAMLLDQKILLVSPVAVLIRLTNIWIEEGFFASVWFSFCR